MTDSPECVICDTDCGGGGGCLQMTNSPECVICDTDWGGGEGFYR